MTDAPTRPRPGVADPRVDLRLARLHLRMGQLGLARAALEALAGGGELDAKGLIALAEARWRTGDLTGAGEAAQAYLSGGSESTVALVIAAESIAAVGRPAEARRLAARALERTDVPLDSVFAGMPRSQIWPVDASDAGQPAGTLFGADPHDKSAGRGSRAAATGPATRPPEQNGTATVRTPDAEGLWGADEVEPEDLPEPAEELDAGRAALDGGRHGEAAVRFSIVLRSAPALAPAVLEATEPPGRRSAEIEIVRGDAFRLVGHELDARRAYAAAAAALRGADPTRAAGHRADRTQSQEAP